MLKQTDDYLFKNTVQLRSSYESISKKFNDFVDRNKQAHCGDSLHALTIVYVIKYYTVINEIGENTKMRR